MNHPNAFIRDCGDRYGLFLEKSRAPGGGFRIEMGRIIDGGHEIGGGAAGQIAAAFGGERHSDG